MGIVRIVKLGCQKKGILFINSKYSLYRYTLQFLSWDLTIQE